MNKSYGSGNSQSTEENVAKAGKIVTGTFLTVATIACPPAGATTAATLMAAGSTVKGISRLADEDSRLREVGDAFDWMARGTMKTSAKQLSCVKGAEEILKK